MWLIFCKILPDPYNIVMALNNVMIALSLFEFEMFHKSMVSKIPVHHVKCHLTQIFSILRFEIQ